MYEAHEYALAFPEMPPDEFAALSDSIASEGLHHPITLFEGRVLDGRHRYRACIERQVVPRFEEFSGSDALAFVVAENARRRHLTPSQVAMAGTKLAEIEAERARRRQVELAGSRPSQTLPPRGGKGDTGETAEVVASKVGVSRNTMQRAINVRKRGTPALVRAVESGRMTVAEGERVAALRPSAQNRIAALEDRQQRAAETARATNLRNGALAREASGRRDLEPPPLPGTPYVRRVLGRLELLRNDLAADFQARDAEGIASRFVAEFDGGVQQLERQLALVRPVVRALALIDLRVPGGSDRQ